MLTLMTFAQKPKVELEGDRVKVNGVSSFLVESKTMGNQFLSKNLAGELLISMMYQDYTDPAKVSSANKTGKVVYIEVTFLGSGNVAEFAPLGIGKKMIAKQVIENEFLNGDKINETGEINFCKIYGRKYSAERARLSQPDVIIINR